MKGRDTHIGRNAREVLWARSSSPVVEEGENSDGERVGRTGVGRVDEYPNKEGRGIRREVYTNGAKTRGGQRGEGDATRLINRHADNHSGFMVTTDYQVVQGGIFHIRDVTLFQWGNTCSARYKLHERAYTGQHVCCLRILPSPSLHPILSFSSGVYVYVYTRGCGYTQTWKQDATELARRGVQVLSLSVPLYLLDSPSPSSVRPDLAAACPSLKIIPTFARVRLQKWPATFPRDRSPDRSATTPYTGSISGLEIRTRTLTGGTASLASPVRHSWNFETTRPKGWNCRWDTARSWLLREREKTSRNCYQNGTATLPLQLLRVLHLLSYVREHGMRF